MEHWFDNLTRITLGGQSRRDVLRGVISFAAAAMTRPLPGFASTEQVVVPAQYMPTASSTSCNGGRSHPYAGGCSIGGDADERIIKIYMARKMHKDTISIDQTITLRQQSVAEETRIRHSWFGPIVEITTTRGPGEPVLLRLRLGPIMSGFQEMSLVTEDGKHFTGKIDGRDLAPFSITQGKQQLRFTDGTLPRTPVYPSGLNEAVKTLYENARKEIYSCITKSKWSDREDRHPANLGSFAGSSLAAAGFMGARSEALLSEFSLIPHFGEETTERHRPSGTPNSTILAANEGRYDCPHETQFYSNPKQHADCQHCIEACYATAAACAALGCTVIPLFGCAIGAPLFCSAADIACLEVCNHAAFPCCPIGCGHGCCESRGQCLDPNRGVCCGPDETPCHGRTCCDSPDACLPDGTCCPEGIACGNTCCAGFTPCCGDQCCATACCNGRCCNPGQSCHPTLQICCSVPCGPQCCLEGQVCSDPQRGICAAAGPVNPVTCTDPTTNITVNCAPGEICCQSGASKFCTTQVDCNLH